MRYQEMGKNADCKAILQDVFAAKGSCLCNIIIPAEACVVPQVKFGRPNEDMEPLLPRATFFEQMIVKTLDASKA
jgi:acetolactate synthase-1/2/3 large subunit